MMKKVIKSRRNSEQFVIRIKTFREDDPLVEKILHDIRNANRRAKKNGQPVFGYRLIHIHKKARG